MSNIIKVDNKIIKRINTKYGAIEGEQFSHIPQYSRHIISSFGRIFNDKGTQLKPKLKKGNLRVTLTYYGTRHQITIHRIVRELFREEDIRYRTIPKFIDGNPANLAPDNVVYDKKEIEVKNPDDIIKNDIEILDIAEKVLISLGHGNFLYNDDTLVGIHSAHDIKMEMYMHIKQLQYEYNNTITSQYAFACCKTLYFQIFNAENMENKVYIENIISKKVLRLDEVNALSNNISFK